MRIAKLQNKNLRHDRAEKKKKKQQQKKNVVTNEISGKRLNKFSFLKGGLA